MQGFHILYLHQGPMNSLSGSAVKSEFCNSDPICDPLSENPPFLQKIYFLLKCIEVQWRIIRVFLKNFTQALIALISNKVLLKPTKTRHYRTPQFIRDMKSLFGVCRVNETKVTSTYLRYSRNEGFYHDFFVETDSVSRYADGY